MGCLELNLICGEANIWPSEGLLEVLRLDRVGAQAVVDAIESRITCHHPIQFSKYSPMAMPDATRTLGRVLSAVARLSAHGARLSSSRWNRMMKCIAPAGVSCYPYFDVPGVVVNNARDAAGRLKPDLVEVLTALTTQGHSATNVVHAACRMQDPELLRMLLPHFDAAAPASDGLTALQVLEKAPPGFKGRAEPGACRALLQAAAARDHARRVVDEIGMSPGVCP